MDYSFIDIQGYSIPIVYIHKLNKRRYSIRFCHKHFCLKVSLSAYATPKEVYHFLQGHQEWIMGNIKKREQFEDGNQVMILGTPYTIKYFPSNDGNLTFHGNSLEVTCPSPAHIEPVIKFYVKPLLFDYLQPKIEHFCHKIGESYNRIFLKDMRTRWGSCSSKKNLNFSLSLAFVPRNCIDYVAAHEVCHLRHLNHSAEFWNLVESLYPYYKDTQDILKKIKI